MSAKRTTSVRYDIGHNSNGILFSLAGRFVAVGLHRKSADLPSRQFGPIHVSWGRVYQKPVTLPLRLVEKPTADVTNPVDPNRGTIKQ